MRQSVLSAIFGALAVAAAAPADPDLAFVEVATGLSRPLSVCYAPGDYSRLFIVQQRVDVQGVPFGQVRILDLNTGAMLPDPFITVGPVVVEGGAAGLLGMAFDSDYANSGAFYLYSCIAGGPLVQRNVIDRYRVTDDPNVADAGTRERILTIDDPNTIPNGGCRYLAPDGTHHLATGD